MKPIFPRLTVLVCFALCSVWLSGCSNSGSMTTRAPAGQSVSTGSFGNKNVPAYCSKPVTTEETSLADKKDRSDIFLQLGIGYMQQNKFDTALAQMEKAVQFSPSSAQVHSAMALLQSRMNRTDEARKSYQKARRIAPGDPEINNNFGYFLYQQGDHLEADKLFQCAIANPLYNTPWRAYYNAGLNALKAGELKQADIYLRTTRQLAPNLPQPLYYLADLAHQRGSHLQAADYLARYRKNAPPSPDSLWLGIQIARALENRDMEASDTLTLKNLFPDSDQAQSLYSQ